MLIQTRLVRPRRVRLPADGLVLTAAAAAQTRFYVGGAGCTDSGSGAQVQPFRTISKGTVSQPLAVKAATPGHADGNRRRPRLRRDLARAT